MPTIVQWRPWWLNGDLAESFPVKRVNASGGGREMVPGEAGRGALFLRAQMSQNCIDDVPVLNTRGDLCRSTLMTVNLEQLIRCEDAYDCRH